MHLQSELTAFTQAVHQREAWWRTGVSNMASHIGSERHRCITLEQQTERTWTEKILALEQGLSHSELSMSEHQRVIQQQKSMMLNAEVNVSAMPQSQAQRIAKAGSEISQLHAELREAHTALQGAVAQRSESNLRVESGAQKIASLKGERDTLEGKLFAAQRDFSTYISEKTNLVKQIEELRAREHALKLAHDMLQQNLEELNLEAMTDRIDQMEEEFRLEREQRDAGRANFVRLRANFDCEWEFKIGARRMLNANDTNIFRQPETQGPCNRRYTPGNMRTSDHDWAQTSQITW
jgi:chromosome segregation ATPase